MYQFTELLERLSEERAGAAVLFEDLVAATNGDCGDDDAIQRVGKKRDAYDRLIWKARDGEEIVCERCGRPIEVERLATNPDSVYCAACAAYIWGLQTPRKRSALPRAA